jgi:hypothetical protein
MALELEKRLKKEIIGGEMFKVKRKLESHSIVRLSDHVIRPGHLDSQCADVLQLSNREVVITIIPRAGGFL